MCHFICMQPMDTKNGATVKLDGTEDHLIVREAGEFSEG